MNNNSSKYKISDLSPHLFWDVDKELIKWEEDEEFLVQRVLEYGMDRDWQILKTVYGTAKIGKVAQGLRSLDKISAQFIATISGIPINRFRCYTTRQFLPHYSGY